MNISGITGKNGIDAIDQCKNDLSMTWFCWDIKMPVAERL